MLCPAATSRAFSLRSNRCATKEHTTKFSFQAMSAYLVSRLVVTGLIYISDRQLAGELSRVEWSKGTTKCEQINRKLSINKNTIPHGMVFLFKPATFYPPRPLPAKYFRRMGA